MISFTMIHLRLVPREQGRPKTASSMLGKLKVKRITRLGVPCNDESGQLFEHIALFVQAGDDLNCFSDELASSSLRSCDAVKGRVRRFVRGLVLARCLP